MKKSPFGFGWSHYLICLMIILLSAEICFIVWTSDKILSSEHKSAVVFVDGKEFKRLPLNEPTDLIFDGVHIKVERGAISFCASDCEDKNCVKGGRIRQVGSTLACLQKNIVIQIFKAE